MNDRRESRDLVQAERGQHTRLQRSDGINPERTSQVWEIRGADFTASPVYPSNFSVRFPRFIRIREDKGVEQATTMEQLADMYRAQGEPSKAVAGEEEEEEEQEAQDNAMQEAAASELDEAQTVDSQ